jgi:hypothetical protein
LRLQVRVQGPAVVRARAKALEAGKDPGPASVKAVAAGLAADPIGQAAE